RGDGSVGRGDRRGEIQNPRRRDRGDSTEVARGDADLHASRDNAVGDKSEHDSIANDRTRTAPSGSWGLSMTTPRFRVGLLALRWTGCSGWNRFVRIVIGNQLLPQLLKLRRPFLPADIPPPADVELLEVVDRLLFRRFGIR